MKQPKHVRQRKDYCACALVVRNKNVREMAWLRQLLRTNDSPDEDSQAISPEKRFLHECALIDDHLHLFGGYDGSKCFPRNEIFGINVRREEKKWIRRFTRGRTIPPPCFGARCVVMDKLIYSYGGCSDKARYLGIVYRLDPKKMEWIEVATPIGGKKPHERSHCCLCSIGSRMVMFGDRAKRSFLVNNSSLGLLRKDATGVMIFMNFDLKREMKKVCRFDINLTII